MKLALAQIDSRIGDFSGNRRRILAAAAEARRHGADLAVLPEMVVTGYPPRDLLLDPAFVARAVAVTEEIAQELKDGPQVVLGTVAPSGSATPGHPGLWNAAAFLSAGRIAALVPKRLLPAYDVFHEPRWFVPGGASSPLEIAGRRLGLLICEDLWDSWRPAPRYCWRSPPPRSVPESWKSASATPAARRRPSSSSMPWEPTTS
ncbi:MAG TPA: nitrilase-related carbon-nitrogen hydrolase [Thermoanaerobaculia bacterium]|nr:nitrilase-related carbon-nitrogen hydrolase [Thermoanaerobaculia bacterium]